MSTSTTTFYNGILCFGAFLSSDEIAIYDKWTLKQMPNGQTEGRTAVKIKLNIQIFISAKLRIITL